MYANAIDGLIKSIVKFQIVFNVCCLLDSSAYGINYKRQTKITLSNSFVDPFR